MLPAPGFDQSDRKRMEALVKYLAVERDEWSAIWWRDLRDYILPGRGRLLNQDRKPRRDLQKVIDTTMTFASRTLASGMVVGITSPARPWFEVHTPDTALNDWKPVKVWLAEVAQIIRDMLIRSNFYNVIPSIYRGLGVYGTAALGAFEDDTDGLRFYSFPIGGYALGLNASEQVDTLTRCYTMTVRQIVEKFGRGPKGMDAISVSTRNLWNAGATETRKEVVQVIAPNYKADPNRLGAQFKRIQSYYFEPENQEGELMVSGFDEFPVMAPRWDAECDDTYGISPAMDVLGDVMGLQAYHRRKAEAVEKMVNPPMIGPTDFKNQKVGIRPGDITFLDTPAGHEGIRPMYQVNFPVNDVRLDIQEIQQRINRGMFADLFLMLSQSDRREITAEEIRARQEEKILALSPVLERMNDELLEPLINRCFAIAERRRMLPPPPQELIGMDLKVQFTSILAQAQKSVGLAAQDRLVATTMQMAQLDPSVMDNLDLDETVRQSGNMLGVNPKVVRSSDEVDAIRQQRAAAQQRQQQLMEATEAAKGVKALSEAKTDGNSVLSQMTADNEGLE